VKIPATLGFVLVLATSGCDTTCDPGDICTWFGTPQVAGLSEDGTHRLDASTFWVVDVAFDPTDDRAVILDWNNHRIIKLDEEDRIVTLTGVGGRLGDGPEGAALTAEWNHPTDVDWMSDGSMVIAAWHNSRVAKLDFATGTISWLAGTGGRDFAGDGGLATEAVLDLPCGVRVDEDDNIFIADMANQRIRRIAPDGTIDTIAGVGAHGFNGDGPLLETMFASPALQRAEPAFKMDYADGSIWIADTHNGRIRHVDLAAGTVTTVAGMGETPPDSDNGTVCTTGCGYSGDGGPATEAMLDTPSDVAVADDGTLYIADTDNSCIRKVDTDGIITTFAGICGEQGYDGDYGPATEALLARPFGVEVGPDGAVYISDTFNSRVARVMPE
jgi:streptogramin lyase